MKQPEPFGKYLLLGQVAIGGMAEIYKARYADPRMPQIDIAIKRILPSYTEDESFVTMFKDEGNIAIRLKHPNIVNIYEIGEVNNDWYIAMEYIHGTDMRVLSDACERNNKRFTPTQVARIMCEISKALFYAHSCTADDGTPLNIVHRDCTPHNIMVSYKGEVKLMDFGIAKAASRATKTRVGTVKGKSSYMSPEQAKGKLLDGRSDMFTLGTVAWELLTGYRLFKAGSDFEILTKVLKSELIHPSDIDSNIPRSLGDIIMKTLERDRDLRYATCGVLASTLDNWILANGDGSDANLGPFTLALMNKQGHSVNEIRDYVPGASLYLYEDGNFIRKNAAEPAGPRMTVPYQSAASAAPVPVAAPEPIPFAPPPGFPDPSLGLQIAPRKRVPFFYFILFVLLVIGSIVFTLLAIKNTLAEKTPLPTFEMPVAYIVLKTHPVDANATVSVNGQVVRKEDGSVATTPIYSYPVKLGEHYKIVFEKKGYEPVEIERDIALLSQEIEVTMKTIEEANAEKMDGVPEFVINTEPAEALVKVDGEEMGNSPVTLKDVKFGTEINVEVTVPNSKEYGVASQVITVARGGESNVTIVAEKATKGAAAAAEAPKPSAPEKVVAKNEPAPKAQNTNTAKAQNTNTAKAQTNTAKAQTNTAKTQTNTAKTQTNTAKTQNTKSQNTNTAKAAAASGSGMGTISVKIIPWATLKIDSATVGNARENSPVVKKYKTGNHTIEFRCMVDGKTGNVVKRNVTVKADKTVSVVYNCKTNKWM
ncbi:MAG: protein kinase [Proteobacteria bacterium]|nr:protein kinase [Pseudomonadota bacterium]